MIAIHTVLDPAAVEAIAYATDSLSLLPFYPGGEADHLPSAAARWFKNTRFAPADPPAADAFKKALAESMAIAVQRWQPTHVCRVLSSWETRPSAEAPLEGLAQMAADRLGASFVHPMRRTSPRPPMSIQPRLSGADRLKERIHYAAQDLIFDAKLPGARVLIIDDIRCAGASEAVWAWAARALGGAEQATAIHLAQTANVASTGETLDVDIDRIRDACAAACSGASTFFTPAWLSLEDHLLHRSPGCREARGRLVLWWRGLRTGGIRACAHCGSAPWWSLAHWLSC